MTRFAICAVFLLVLSACGSGTPVTFHNASEHSLRRVVISGRGYEASLGTVAPGQSLQTRVHPAGESGLAVSFIADGRTFGYAPQVYFEGGGLHSVTATVDRDLTVVAGSEAWP